MSKETNAHGLSWVFFKWHISSYKAIDLSMTCIVAEVRALLLLQFLSKRNLYMASFLALQSQSGRRQTASKHIERILVMYATHFPAFMYLVMRAFCREGSRAH